MDLRQNFDRIKEMESKVNRNGDKSTAIKEKNSQLIWKNCSRMVSGSLNRLHPASVGGVTKILKEIEKFRADKTKKSRA